MGARLILQRLGLVPDKDVTILQVGGTSTRVAALSKGSVETTVLPPEFHLVAKKAGFNTLADPLSIKIDFPQNTIATTRSLLRSQREGVANYLKAIVEAIHFFKQNRDESVRIMGKYLRIQDRELLEEIHELYKNILQPLPLPSPEGMQTLLAWMAQRDARAKEAKAEQFLDSTSLLELEKSGFIKSIYGR